MFALRPGGPGIEPKWTRNIKVALGTAYSTSSGVWYSVDHGSLTEVYYPTIDSPQIRDLQFLVTDGETFLHDGRRHFVDEITCVSQAALGFDVINREKEGRTGSEITARKRNEIGIRFLADASAMLASSLDYPVTLNKVARLAVPTLADWCVVDLGRDDGSVEQVATAHVDPTKEAFAGTDTFVSKLPLFVDEIFAGHFADKWRFWGQRLRNRVRQAHSLFRLIAFWRQHALVGFGKLIDGRRLGRSVFWIGSLRRRLRALRENQPR